jgi:hypothetical protein
MHKIRPSLHESFHAQSKPPPNPVAPLAASTLIILFVKMLKLKKKKKFPSKYKNFVKEDIESFGTLEDIPFGTRES